MPFVLCLIDRRVGMNIAACEDSKVVAQPDKQIAACAVVSDGLA